MANIQPERTRLPRSLRRAILAVSAGISRLVVRPEADRLLRLLSEPMLESAAYTDRAIRDLELRLPAAGPDELVAMHAFRALAGIDAGAHVLLVGSIPALLERGLLSVGCSVTRTSVSPDRGVRAERYRALVMVSAGIPAPSLEGWDRVQRLDVEGVEVVVAMAD